MVLVLVPLAVSVSVPHWQAANLNDFNSYDTGGPSFVLANVSRHIPNSVTSKSTMIFFVLATTGNSSSCVICSYFSTHWSSAACVDVFTPPRTLRFTSTTSMRSRCLPGLEYTCTPGPSADLIFPEFGVVGVSSLPVRARRIVWPLRVARLNITECTANRLKSSSVTGRRNTHSPSSPVWR